MASDSAGEELLADASWMERNWVWLSLAAGVANIIFWFTQHSKPSDYPIVLGFLLSSVYALHQLEEHGYDIYGRRYMFVPTFNAIMSKTLGVTVTNSATLYINVITVWVNFPVCAWMSHRGNRYIPAAVSWGTAVVNGAMGHLLPLLTLQYVPGAFQSAFMVPSGIFILHYYYGQLVVPIIGGFIFHAVGLIVPIKMFPDFPEVIVVPLFLLFAGVVVPFAFTLLSIPCGKGEKRV